MNFEFSDEQRLLLDTVKRANEREVEPLLESYSGDEPLPKEACLKIMKLLQPLGALGCRVPVEDGGSGLGATGMGIFCEILPFPAASLLMVQDLATTRICRGSSEELKARVVPPLLNGDRIACSCTTEPDAGSDVRSLKTKAIPSGDEYVINGVKTWISGGIVADTLVAICSMGKDEKGRNILTPFVVEKDVSPFQANSIKVAGLVQDHLSEVTFEDCHVPRGNMLVKAAGHAHRLFSQGWLSQRACSGLCSVRVGQKAIDAGIRYARGRKQFGKPIGSFQLIQGMIAEMSALLDASRLLCYRALKLCDNGIWCYKESSMAKHFAAEAALKVTNMAIEIHGAYGMSRDMAVEQYQRDARLIAFAEGTIEIQKLIHAREILGMQALM